MGKETDIAVSLVANLAYGLLIYGARYLPRTLKTDHRWNSGVFIGAGLCWASLNTVSFVWFSRTTPYMFLLSSSIFGGWIWNQLRNYWATGIVGVDRSIETGLTYSQSLRQCRSRLAFMGIGAHKLTTSSEFEEAIRRCATPTHPVRLLLSHPENDLLDTAGKKEGQGALQYQQNVRESLGKIAHLKHNRGLNIEVRLYRRDQRSTRIIQFFRLMFINDELCLMSYNVFGEGSGRKQPQMHIRRDVSKRDVDSFYHAFHCHFEETWRTSIENDLREFLNGNAAPK